jgi:pilus assembly protein Flp/PilA
MKMRKEKNAFAQFLKNDSGATAIEYGLLAAILAVGIIVGTTGIGSVVTNMWNGVSTDVGAT